MKINNIDFVSSDGTNASNFSFRDLNSTNPYNVKNITGLDADEITTKFYGFSDLDPLKKYYTLFLEKRQVVINVGLNPQFADGETYDSLRDRLYRNISSSRTGLIKLVFKYDDTEIAQVFGFVKKLESNLFLKSPEVTITIECDDAILKCIEPVEVDTSEFGTLPITAIIDDPVSTAPHGFEFALAFTEHADVFIMNDQIYTGWRFLTIYDFHPSDELYFSSKPEDKFFYLRRAGNTIHLIDKLLVNSVWPIIFPGNNRFTVSVEADFIWLYFRHHYSYWGV